MKLVDWGEAFSHAGTSSARVCQGVLLGRQGGMRARCVVYGRCGGGGSGAIRALMHLLRLARPRSPPDHLAACMIFALLVVRSFLP